jgi:hypothetical protein
MTLGGASAAHAAATLVSPPAMAFEFGDDSVLYCTIRNVGSAPTKVTIAGFGFDQQFYPGPTVTLDPMQGTSSLIVGSPGVPAGDAAQCRFIVSGSAKNVRAAAVYYSPTLHRYTHALPAR